MRSKGFCPSVFSGNDDIDAVARREQHWKNYYFCGDGGGVFWSQCLFVLGKKTAVWT